MPDLRIGPRGPLSPVAGRGLPSVFAVATQPKLTILKVRPLGRATR